MRNYQLTVGPIATNCYLVYLRDHRQLYIIDPGANANEIIAHTDRFPEVDKVSIMLTHAHVDHISAVGEVARAFGVERVMLDPADWEIYYSPENEILPYLMAPEDLPEVMDFEDDGLFTVLRVPGHTPGGCAFYFEHGGSRALFCGDTLFAGSIGRTDLPGGDSDALMNSIRTKLLTLPRLTPIFPGHGESSTIGKEMMRNPYLQ